MKKLYDKKLKFYPKSHKYKIGKRNLVSVTTFISELFDKFNERETARGLNKRKGTKWYKMGVRKILALWKEKREYGSLIHNQIERFINGTNILKVDELEQKTKQAVTFYSRLLVDLEEPTAYPEVKIYSEKYGLAGTVDLLITHNQDGQRWATLVDWKTNDKFTTEGYNGKTGTNKHTDKMSDSHISKYGLQLCIYSKILEDEYGMKIKNNFLIHLKDDEYTIYSVDYNKLVLDVVTPLLEEKVKEWERKKKAQNLQTKK